jgi:peptide chain release factor subunit 1
LAAAVPRIGAVDRLLQFRSTDPLVLSAYILMPADPGELAAETRIHSVLKPIRELIDSDELTHNQRESLRGDVERVNQIAEHGAELRGRTIAVFSCHRAALYEEMVIPPRRRDRAVVDETPYIRPLLSVMDEAHRCCVVVVDRDRAVIYEFFMDELEECTTDDNRKLGKAGYPGHRGDERRAHDRVQEITKKHFKRTVDAVDAMVRSTGAELLIVGGHEETVAQFIPFLPKALHEKVVGTFVIDPRTMTPAAVREQAKQTVDAYELSEETQLVDQAMERVATRGMGAVGLEWCLLAVNEKAVDFLLINDDSQRAGRACDNCGWLGLTETECPVDGQPTRETVDVIDEMAEAVFESSGRVEHVYADTPLSEHTVAALLHFPVPRPEELASG